MKTNNKYQVNATSRKIRTSNLGIFKDEFTSMSVPVAELVSNGVDAALANKTDKIKMVDVAFESINGIDYIVVKNTGKPIKDLAAMLDLGHEGGEVHPDCTTNHLRGVGFKYPVGYFSPKYTDFIIETRRKDGWHKVTGPYKEIVTIEKLDTKDFLYGDHFVTRIAIRMENKISADDKNNAKEFLRKKFSVILMKDKALKLFFDGEELSYVIHGENGSNGNGNIVDDKQEILKRLFVGEKDCEERRKEVKFVKQGGFTFAEVDCPVINGKVHILSMQAPNKYQGTNIMGVSIFNLGTLVEYSCGNVIHKMTRRATNRMNNFHAMPSNRNEFSTLSTYVDLLPGEGYAPSFTNDKRNVNWEKDETSRKLRIFIDDVVGGYYREFVRIHKDLASRKEVDDFMENLCSEGNYAYIREGAIWEDGFKGKISECANPDGILIKKTQKNIDRIQAYKSSVYGCGRRETYKLTSDDFDLDAITPPEHLRTDDWTYDFKVIEYKNVRNPRLTADDIASAEKYVKFLSYDFGLDRKRISIVLVGNVDANNYEFQKYLDISKQEGFRITITDPPILRGEDDD